ncbi:hypothetical protein BABA_15832 [Neobacillus bataviensis LMG 21833]|uniref:Uncharacterized protein n=1 Tax=Neobacillus bataviensis LMG 21833 TaxID=1117379 RepID=K6DE72_9BACI|nr:hypothetical protein BABA_15832 [Neobacillus bataviensis LMG 21833]
MERSKWLEKVERAPLDFFILMWRAYNLNLGTYYTFLGTYYLNRSAYDIIFGIYDICWKSYGKFLPPKNCILSPPKENAMKKGEIIL